MELTDKEMQKVTGGVFPTETLAISTGIITFIIGVISGITNPHKCNN